MSYSIIYNRQFIKIGEKILPMFEAGCSNVYESNNERRARDWSEYAWLTAGEAAAEPNAIMARLDSYRAELIKSCEERYAKSNDAADLYKDKDFGSMDSLAFHGKSCWTTTWGMYYNWVVKGIAEAKTIEELRAMGVILEMHVSRFDSEEFTKETGLEIWSGVTINSAEQFTIEYARWKAYYGDKRQIHFTLYGVKNLELIKIAEKAKKIAKPENYVEVKEFYVISLANGNGFFTKFMRGNKYQYAYTATHVETRKFLKQDKAIRFHEKMKSASAFKVEKMVVDQPVKVRA
jgi:hypothetical protein